MYKIHESNLLPVVCLGHYHPYRVFGEKNPGFDSYSGRILNVKGFQDDDIKKFSDTIRNLLDDTEAVVCYVPSSDANKTDTGVKRIAKLLCNNIRIDATDCLVRHTTIPKLATGGNRDKQVHIDSIVVENALLIKDKNVLLIDDVTTSHNSLFACKQLLIDAGALEVYCLALGQTD